MKLKRFNRVVDKVIKKCGVGNTGDFSCILLDNRGISRRHYSDFFGFDNADSWVTHYVLRNSTDDVSWEDDLKETRLLRVSCLELFRLYMIDSKEYEYL